ncbi:MAG: class I SAM-dependent methyltransferase [Chloroflexi bacterium]|nr:class I SAM-dependent methyltransferase [Chloroflexota bacterium]MQC26036.1 class I SAM-dependent methyltransferase [Chloroflexota bacterium]
MANNSDHPFDKEYFQSARYARVSFARYSQYWWSNRYYALLAAKHGPPSGKVLEVGCGLGHLLQRLTGQYEVHGVDVNEWALEQSRNNVPQGHFALRSAEDLSLYEDSTFQIVIAKHVTEHLPNPEKAIQEIGRVLAPGGIFVMGTPNTDSPMHARKGKTWVGYQDPTHISLHSPTEWLAMLNAAGLKERKVFSDGFWDPPYVRFVPQAIQRLWYGWPGGLQAILGGSFLPLSRGESLIMIADKQRA